MKKNAISLERKLSILVEVEKGRKKGDIAAEFEIPLSTLSTIIKKSNDIKRLAESGCSSSMKRRRIATHSDVDDALLQWFQQVRSHSLPVDGPLLSEKATQLSLQLNCPDFIPSIGWLERWKKRHGIHLRAISGEATSVNAVDVDDWRITILPHLLKDYSDEDIFNADETGLFWRMLPEKTLEFKGKVCVGSKHSKERITVLLCTNMTGSTKLQPLIIGKSTAPRCFRGVKQLPVKYTANKKSWMTGKIWETWLHQLDWKMRSEQRKILLLVDNCPAHPKVPGLQNVKVVYLPPNTTAKLQPLDQGIINSFKLKYRSRLLKKSLAAYESDEQPNFNLKQGIDLLSAAWNEVTPSTIANCWYHAGFKRASADDHYEEDIRDVSAPPLDDIFDRLRQFMDIPSEVVPAMYVSLDNDLPTDDIKSAGQIQLSFTEELNSESDVDEPELKLPSSADIMRSIETLRLFLQCEECDTSSQQLALNKLEDFTMDALTKRKLQTKLTDYFKPNTT